MLVNEQKSKTKFTDEISNVSVTSYSILTLFYLCICVIAAASRAEEDDNIPLYVGLCVAVAVIIIVIVPVVLLLRRKNARDQGVFDMDNGQGKIRRKKSLFSNRLDVRVLLFFLTG
jgi:hypothetical protein